VDYRSTLGRIRAAVRRGTYLVTNEGVPPAQRDALAEIAAAIAAPGCDPDAVRQRIQQLHASGRIDQVMKLSALGVLAASPHVGDYEEASRLAGQQELAALDHGGPSVDAYIASAHRHRGVVAYLLGHYAVALDWFTRALERERSAENLGNVLGALVRLGEHEEAHAMLDRVRTSFPTELRRAVESRVLEDDDLSPLRSG
jgi:tetratricopeptide (TPR) repeat protein